MKIFTIFDSKVESYSVPFFQPHVGHAIRQFTDLVNDPKTSVGKYPEDYTLFEIGEYDEVTGKITQYDANKSLGCAVEFVKKQLDVN